jgi:hypothetical protein
MKMKMNNRKGKGESCPDHKHAYRIQPSWKQYTHGQKKEGHAQHTRRHIKQNTWKEGEEKARETSGERHKKNENRARERIDMGGFFFRHTDIGNTHTETQTQR